MAMTLVTTARGGDRRIVVAGMFSTGHAYDRFMGRWSRALAPRFVRFAAVRDGEAVLDVGSGTGALAAAVAALAPSTTITGIDPAASYVEIADALHAGRPDSKWATRNGFASSTAASIGRCRSWRSISFRIPRGRWTKWFA
jgi:SAM-dependent methyltransferase